MPVAVKGYRQFVRACDRAGRETKTQVRGTLREVGEHVRAEWASRFSRIDPRSASGYRVSVRTTGVSVRQSLRKTTGKRRDYGALQQRYGMRVAQDLQPTIERDLEDAIGTVADHFDKN